MIEEAKTDESKEGKSKIELPPYFPTSIERAKSGLQKFNEAMERYPILRKVIESDEYYQDTLRFVLMGFMPESGFYSGAGFNKLANDEERQELKKIYEEELDLKTYYWQKINERGKYDRSIFNPTSVEKVIKNCPDPNLFPEEAKKNPMDWILKHPLEWDDSKIPLNSARFGVLSGYSPWASSQFPEFIQAKEKFIDTALTEEEKESYNLYSLANRRNRMFPQSINEKIKSAIDSGLLTAGEADLLKDYFTPAGRLIYFGDGFSDADEEYFNKIKAVLDEVGMDYRIPQKQETV